MVVPIVPLCGVAAGWLRSSLRVCPGLAGRGAWGGSRQVRARVNHILVCAAARAGDTQRSGRAPGRAGSRSRCRA